MRINHLNYHLKILHEMNYKLIKMNILIVIFIVVIKNKMKNMKNDLK